MFGKRINKSDYNRRGNIVIVGGVMMTALVGMAAFAVDYGYIIEVRATMQRAADAAVLAAAQDLIPADDGSQDVSAVRATARSYVVANLGDPSFQVPAADIEIGRYDPDTIYSNLTLLDTGIYDAVRITLRRDGDANPLVPLFFAKILGTDATSVTATATAVLQKPTRLGPGTQVLPFAIPKGTWDGRATGDNWSIYGDGKVKDDSGNTIPGNWGTVDIGPPNNSTANLNDQILNGLSQSDLNALYADGRIVDISHIDASDAIWLNADPGLSSGVKHSIRQVSGQAFVVPIYSQLGGSNGNGNGNGGGGNGNNLEYQITGWGVVEVGDSNWGGSNNTSVTIKKTFTYDGNLRPSTDLSEAAAIEGAFTSPVLVQ